MARVLPRDYIMGIIIFTILVLSVVGIFNALRTDDSSFVDEDQFQTFNDSFNVYNNVNDQTASLQDSVENAQTDFGVFGVLNSLISSAWNTLKLLLSSFSFMNAALTGFSTILGLPFWLSVLIIDLVIIIILFGIYSAIFQRDI